MWGIDLKLSRGKMAGLVLLNVIVVVYALHLLNSQFWESGRPKMPASRAAQMLRHLPDVSKTPEATTLFFGHSIFQFFLNPMAFDNVYTKESMRSVSFNLAMTGNMGLGQFAQLLRMGGEFSSIKKKFRSSIFEFSPISYSREFHYREHFRLNYYQPRMFFSNSVFWELIKLDPFMAIFMGVDYFFRPVPHRMLFPYSNWRALEMPILSGRWIGIMNLFDERRFFDKSAWSLDLRGARGWGLPATSADFEKALSSFHSPGVWQSVVDQYRRGLAIDANFKFDLRPIILFVSSLQIAKSFSQKVYVVVLPLAPLLDRHVNQFVDSEGIIDFVRAQSGVEIVDLRYAIPLQDVDFADPQHPRHETMNRLVKILAERLTEQKK